MIVGSKNLGSGTVCTVCHVMSSNFDKSVVTGAVPYPLIEYCHGIVAEDDGSPKIAEYVTKPATYRPRLLA